MELRIPPRAFTDLASLPHYRLDFGSKTALQRGFHSQNDAELSLNMVGSLSEQRCNSRRANPERVYRGLSMAFFSHVKNRHKGIRGFVSVSITVIRSWTKKSVSSHRL